MNQRIKNLLTFHFLYNGYVTNNDLIYQSPDYLMEKWNSLIKIPHNNSSYKEELKNIDLYNRWVKIWGEDKIPDNILMFIFISYKVTDISKLLDIFEKYIENLDINNKNYTVHPILNKSIDDIYKRIVSKDIERNYILKLIIS